MAWRLATWPTRRWPSSVNATTDGVTRAPSAFGITSAWPPSIVAATTEFVVPRSMPTALAIWLSLSGLRARADQRSTRSLVVGRRWGRSRPGAALDTFRGSPNGTDTQARLGEGERG